MAKRSRSPSSQEAVKMLRGYGVTCSPKQLAQVLGGNPYYYNIAARNGSLGYEFEWHGKNLRIFTDSVIKKIIGI